MCFEYEIVAYSLTNEQNYMDVSILPNYLPEYSLNNTYFDVDHSAPTLPVKQKNIYLDTSGMFS